MWFYLHEISRKGKIMEIRKSLVTWGLRWDWMLTTDGFSGWCSYHKNWIVMVVQVFKFTKTHKVIHWVSLMVYLNTWLKTKNQWTQEMEECAHCEREWDVECLYLGWGWRKKSSKREYRYRRFENSNIMYRSCISSLVGYSYFSHCTWHLGSRQPLLIVEDWWILFITLSLRIFS